MKLGRERDSNVSRLHPGRAQGLERERAVRSAPPTQPSNVAGTTPSGLARNSFWTAAAVAMIAVLISLGYYLAIGKPPYGLAAYAPPTHDTDCAAYASANVPNFSLVLVTPRPTRSRSPGTSTPAEMSA